MPSSSKAPKQTHAVQAGTASSSRLDAPPNSPTKQLSNHTSSVAASPASSTNPVVHQKAPATAQSDVAGDPVQPLAQQAITLEHMKQFVELLKGAIVSPTQAQREPKSDSSPLSGEPTTGKKTTGHSRGSKLECKSIREVWDSPSGKYKLTETVDPSAEVSEFDQYVFVDRTRVYKQEMTCFIDIKSEVLCGVLRDLLGDVRAINLRTDKPSIEQRLLYNSLSDLRRCRDEMMRESQTDMAYQHVDLLIRHLEETNRSVTENLLPLLEHDEITFELLWALFRSNQTLFTECLGTGEPQCFKYDSGEFVTDEYGQKFRLRGRLFNYNGERFGEASIQRDLAKFHGRKRIEDLDVLPLTYHPNQDDIRARLVDCGRKFIRLMGTHHRHYHGSAFTYVRGELVKFDIRGRIMLDAKFFREMNPNHFQPKIDNSVQDLADLFATATSLSEDAKSNVSDNASPSSLTEEDLLRCKATVPGFSFSDKRWLEFAVASISDISWEPSIFEALSIPQEKKAMILALAEARTGHLDMVPFDDFVKGKGRGLNVLMHGPPGGGKTMTAEAVSEKLGRPLYSVCAGELGTDAATLENRLSQIFRLTSHWNAILLMDEADIYMEQRTEQDIYRNALVSVFLRNLEYCEAIMFLTTNRVKTFDNAIISRMHMMLAYPDVGFDARKSVWNGFIGKAHTLQGPAEVSAKALKDLAKKELNARQIKNVVATAHALASKEQSQLKISHLEKAIQGSVSFWDDINDIVNKKGMYC